VSRASVGCAIAFSCGGVDHYSFEIFGLQRAAAMRHRKALLQQGGELLLAQPLAPARQRGAVERQFVPEHRLAAEELEIRVLHPARAQHLVGQIVHVLEDQEPGDQPRRQWRLPGPGPVHRAKTCPNKLPIELSGQPHQRVPEVDDGIQRRPE